MSRESEEPSSLRLNIIGKYRWEAMASKLKGSPFLTCMANKLSSIGVHKVDDGYGELFARVSGPKWETIKSRPHVRFR